MSLRAHPYARAEDAAVVVLLRDGSRVGRFGVIPGRARIADADYEIAWGSNWYARDDRNRVGGALLLLQALREAGSLGACGLSSEARQVLLAARFDLVRMPRRILLLGSRPFLGRHLAPALARALAIPADAVLRLAGRAVRWRTRDWDRGYVLRPVDRFDERLDQLERRGRGRFWFPRDHRELNWAIERPWFAETDPDRYRAFYLQRAGDEEVVGYALSRIHSYGPLLVGSLLRWSVEPRAATGVPALLATLISALADDGVHLIELCTTRKTLLRAAAEAGMLPRGHVDLACKLAQDPARQLSALGATLRDFDVDLGEGDMLLA